DLDCHAFFRLWLGILNRHLNEQHCNDEKVQQHGGGKPPTQHSPTPRPCLSHADQQFLLKSRLMWPPKGAASRTQGEIVAPLLLIGQRKPGRIAPAGCSLS